VRTNFAFAAWPYISLSLLAVGIVVRYFQARKQMEAVSAEVTEAKSVFLGSRLWQTSLLFLLAGHVAGVVLPKAVLWWNGSVARLYILEGAAFAVGLAALGSWLVLMWRHLGESKRSAFIELADTVFLSLVFVGLVSGLLMAVFYRWASSWGAITLAPYIASLPGGRPATRFISDMPILVRIHVFSAFAAVAVLPLTRLAAVLVRGLHFCVLITSRPLTAVGQAIAGWVRRRNPAAWLWPEED